MRRYATIWRGGNNGREGKDLKMKKKMFYYNIVQKDMIGEDGGALGK